MAYCFSQCSPEALSVQRKIFEMATTFVTKTRSRTKITAPINSSLEIDVFFSGATQDLAATKLKI